jgi:hypothetical protein
MKKAISLPEERRYIDRMGDLSYARKTAPTATRPAMAMEPVKVEAAPVNSTGETGDTGEVRLLGAAEPVEMGLTAATDEAATGTSAATVGAAAAGVAGAAATWVSTATAAAGADEAPAAAGADEAPAAAETVTVE